MSVGLLDRSTQEGHAIYDPCAPGSRLGVTRAQWDAAMTPGLLALLIVKGAVPEGVMFPATAVL